MPRLTHIIYLLLLILFFFLLLLVDEHGTLVGPPRRRQGDPASISWRFQIHLPIQIFHEILLQGIKRTQRKSVVRCLPRFGSTPQRRRQQENDMAC